MGMLVNGTWQDEDISEFERNGKNVRFDSGFHRSIRPTPTSDFMPERGRYRLYFNRTCPWSHRAVVTRELKGLQDIIEGVLLEPAMGPESWWFGYSGKYRDPEFGATHLHEIYSAADPEFTGRVTIPVLWDKESQTIVNNDSGMIARMLNSEFDKLSRHPEIDFYPKERQKEIDELNGYIADRVNDGVYRCLLSKNQADYEAAFDGLFSVFDTLDQRLSQKRYLLGGTTTEPDWRLFACLVRFDCIYYSLYKCNLKRIVDYKHLWGYTRDLYQIAGVANTVDMEAIKAGYYGIIDPKGVIPKGPEVDFNEPHCRDSLASA